MDKGHPVMLRAKTQDVWTDEDSTLERQNAALQRQVAALREDNEDLRASALWWKALYEAAQRRCAHLENSPRARIISHVDQRFTMTPSTSAACASPDATRVVRNSSTPHV